MIYTLCEFIYSPILCNHFSLITITVGLRYYYGTNTVKVRNRVKGKAGGKQGKIPHKPDTTRQNHTDRIWIYFDGNAFQVVPSGNSIIDDKGKEYFLQLELF
jgi:hypothetical protein